MKRIITALALLAVAAGEVFFSAPSRIKDITFIEGVRDNQLVGYGLVVGLQATGDSLRNSPFTEQSIRSMLDKLGVNVPGRFSAREECRSGAGHRNAATLRRQG